MFKRFLFLACSLSLGCGALFIIPSHAIEYGGIGGIPANPDPDNPRTKSIFVYTLEHGQQKQDGVKIINNSNETKNIEVYATDSEIASGGTFACRQKVDPKRNVGSWVSLHKSTVQLRPGQEETVVFNLIVPKNADVGEHNGCIVIQEAAEAMTTAENGVRLSFRSALRVAVTIPGSIIKNIEFKELRLKEDQKKYVIGAYIQNTGNVSVDTDVQVYVKDVFGRIAYQNGGTYPILTQKEPLELNYEFPKPFWGGLYRTQGSAAYSSNVDEELGEESDKATVKRSPERLFVVFPNTAALLIELFVILGLAFIAWQVVHRSRHRKKVAATWSKYTVGHGDTLVKLARQHHVSWKMLAKANKLHPPYEINPGDIIRLPKKPKQNES